MRTIFLSIASLYLWSALPAVAAEKVAYLMELAPVRGLSGQPAFHGEVMRNRTFGGGLHYGTVSLPSERDDITDRAESLEVEGVYYPFVSGSHGIFLGAGLEHRQTWTGQQTERSSRTWTRTNADERYDRWTVRTDDTSWTQSVGYRFASESLATASIRFSRREVLYRQRAVEDEQIFSTDPATDGASPPRHSFGIMVYAGLLIP